MNILYCGYRDWSIYVLEKLEDLTNHEFTLAADQEEFNIFTNNDSYDITLLVGWSWILNSDYVDNNFTAVIHPSDLPEYAGGSPVQHQIIDGVEHTKITLFRASKKIDAGPIIDKQNVNLTGNLDNVMKNIADSSLILVRRFLDNYPNHNEIPQKIHKTRKRRTPEMSEIKLKDLQEYTAKQMYNKVRALQDPYPNAFIECKDGTKLYLTGVYYG